MPTDKKTFLPFHGHYRNLRVYHVTEALYDLTYTFCQRFLPPYGDRTVDQMVQAARSGKQNIAEGNQAAATSSETEIKLTNVAKASLEELLVDYEDYLRTHGLPQWDAHHPRYDNMRRWASSDNFMQTYAERSQQMTDEEFANLCITLCHQAIYMLGRLIDTLQDRFVTQGGIKERMHAARTNYRQAEDAELKRLRVEVEQLRAEVERLRKENAALKTPRQ
jgi:four helix bundle suffix protein